MQYPCMHADILACMNCGMHPAWDLSYIYRKLPEIESPSSCMNNACTHSCPNAFPGFPANLNLN